MLEESINLDDLEDISESTAEPFSEDSAIIRCGRFMRNKARVSNASNFITSGKTSGDTTVVVIEDDLLPKQKQYIDFVATGMTSIGACNMLGIDIFLPTLWEETVEKDGTYMQCMNILKRKQADLLEEDVWNQAMNNPKSTLLKMFALKARKDEYKDNASPQMNLQTNIHVSIRDKNGNVTPFFVDTSINNDEEVKDG